jgi:hypothetical protein
MDHASKNTASRLDAGLNELSVLPGISALLATIGSSKAMALPNKANAAEGLGQKTSRSSEGGGREVPGVLRFRARAES